MTDISEHKQKPVKQNVAELPLGNGTFEQVEDAPDPWEDDAGFDEEIECPA
jgi:hypothetical protein